MPQHRISSYSTEGWDLQKVAAKSSAMLPAGSRKVLVPDLYRPSSKYELLWNGANSISTCYKLLHLVLLLGDITMLTEQYFALHDLWSHDNSIYTLMRAPERPPPKFFRSAAIILSFLSDGTRTPKFFLGSPDNFCSCECGTWACDWSHVCAFPCHFCS